MGGYTPDSTQVRVDFFTSDGRLKWKYTEAVSFAGLWDFMQPHQALALAWHRHGRLLTGYLAVCLHPYHRYSYPLMLDASGREQLLASARQHYDLTRTEPERLAT